MVLPASVVLALVLALFNATISKRSPMIAWFDCLNWPNNFTSCNFIAESLE